MRVRHCSAAGAKPKDPEKAARKATHLKKKAEEEAERAKRTAAITAARATARAKKTLDAADAAENPAATKEPTVRTRIKLPRHQHRPWYRRAW
jgi:hypothetical protein